MANLTPGSAVEVLVDGFWLRGEIWDASVTAQGLWFHVWCREEGGARYLATVRSGGVREWTPGSRQPSETPTREPGFGS